MKKKGFTLIELLAVIIILAIVALVATPVVLNVIEEARDSANKSTAYGILDAGHLYYTESVFDDSKANKINNYDNLYDDVTLGGEMPEGGSLYVNNKGMTALSVIIDNKCYKKEFAGELEVFESEECTLGYVGEDSALPTVSFEIPKDIMNNGWAKEDFFVTINIDDVGSGPLEYRWCSATTPCDPIALVEDVTGAVSLTTESDNNVVCVIGIDKAGNQSEVTCSDIYKLDKTAPSFEGVGDLVVNKNDVVDLSLGVTANDSLSGIDGTFTYDPTSVDTSVAGTTNVTYTVSDLSGNTNTVTRKVIVDAEAPTVTYTALGDKINSNGWSKEDFYVEANINDQSGLGIASAKWCSTTNDTCEPIADMVGTSMTPLISLESNNNRICIQVIDNNGKTSEVLCSDAYKLDKTVPNVGSINISGTLGTNNWYTSDVSISALNGNDALSGHDSTTVDISSITSITSNTTGTTVTLTTTDLAGNTSSVSEVIKVDKNAPSITAKSGTFEITEGDSVDTSTYFNSPVYSISGGSMSCSPSNTSSLSSGTQTVTCTVTGNNGLISTASKIISVNSRIYTDASNANAPELFNNMIPVKYNGSNWVVADITQKWYDYDNKEWANAVVLKSGVTKNVGSIINVSSEVSQMYVWIPRYKYTIFNGNNGSISSKSINIMFEDGTSSTGTVRCVNNSDGSETCNDSSYGSVRNNYSTYTHPAFTLGTKKLTGIWVGKFEISNIYPCTATHYSVCTECDMTLGIQIKPNVISWRGARIATFYTAIKDISVNYGLSTDSHMMKNIEWGAVAYLSHSVYGKNDEVWINNSNTFTTGCAGNSVNDAQYSGCDNTYNTVNGQQASTTGNIYGVYDMSGGAEEYVMGNMFTSTNVPQLGFNYIYNSGFTGQLYSGSYNEIVFPESRYYDTYKYDIANTTYNRGKLGDATKETIEVYDKENGGWYSDYIIFLGYTNSWFVRGGKFSSVSYSGLFNFSNGDGCALSDNTARVILTAMG